ncbi:MAG: guanylate kinase [Acidimicrobiales bacterium]|nr:guanylate kinase [Acidimicrobiales bacterium]
MSDTLDELGTVVVISGPGGVGKGTVVERLVDIDDSLVLSRSWTTRAPRPGESPEAYEFVTKTDFLNALTAGEFLEWNHFLGSAYYASPVPRGLNGRTLVLEIDVNGARQVLERVPEAILVFIDAPTPEEQQNRLVGRGDTPEQVERRMAAGRAERALAQELPYEYVENTVLDDAVNALTSIIARRTS